MHVLLVFLFFVRFYYWFLIISKWLIKVLGAIAILFKYFFAHRKFVFLGTYYSCYGTSY